MRIKDEQKVIILSVSAGLFVGFLDTLVNYFLFAKGKFWDLLILDVPVHELYVRTFLLASFIVFGYIISGFLTKRKRAEEALRSAIVNAERERARTEAIIAAIGDGISIQDTDFKILYQNQIHKEFIGDHVGAFCFQAYEGKEQVCEGCPVNRTFRDGGIHVAERSVTRGGNTLFFEITASPLRDSAGTIIAGIEVVRDVTERRRLEEQLLHAQKMEAIGRLTGGIAHEFNNIMTAIIGCSEFLKDEVGKNNPLSDCADGILISAERAAKLTRGLLAYSRKQITHKKPLPLNKILRQIEGILLRLLRADITVQMDLSDKDLIVMADQSQIEQVVMNLATNAEDAMPHGGALTIRTGIISMNSEFIKTHGFGKRGMFATIMVEDTGEGIDADTKEKIFEPFFTTKDVGKGTGLGLSIVYGIVDKHNGFIEVVSEPGNGTIFRIFLPLVKTGAEFAQPETSWPPAVYG